jgi:hypothetical protein
MSKFEELDFALEEAREAGLRAFTVPLDDCMKEVGKWHTARMDDIHRLSATGGVVRVQLKTKEDVVPAPPSQLEKALEAKAKEEKADAILEFSPEPAPEPAPEPEAPKLDIPPKAFDGENLT